MKDKYYYYKIKCLHCLNTMRSSEVVYKCENVDALYKNDTSPIGNNLIKGDEVMRRFIAEPIFGNPYLPKSFFKTDEKKIDYEAASEALEKEGSFAEKNIIEDDIPLIMGFSVKKKDGKRIKFKRYCCECHKPLVNRSGELPTFTIAMLGHSTAGKTVMLVMQHVINKANRLDLSINKGTLVLTPNTTHLNRYGEDEVAKSAEKFEDKMIIYGTTTSIPAPHCVIVNYKPKAQEGGYGNAYTSCILSFQDVIGERFTASQEEENAEFEKIKEISQLSDGLYVLTDPLALTNSFGRIEGAYNPKDPAIRGTTKAFASNITERIFENNADAVNKPLVNIMSKADIVQKAASELNDLKIEISDHDEDEKPVCKCLSIHSDMPALANGQEYRFSKVSNWLEEVYKKISASTRDCLRVLDGEGPWSRVLQNQFAKGAFFPVSSIGPKVDFIEIPNEELMPEAPKATEEPVGSSDLKHENLPRRSSSTSESTRTGDTIPKKQYPKGNLTRPAEPEDFIMRHFDAEEEFLKLNEDGAKTQSYAVPKKEEKTQHYVDSKKEETKNAQAQDEKAQKEVNTDANRQTLKRLVSVENYQTLSQITSLDDRVMELRRIENESPLDLLKPRGLELPLLYILMKFNILPDLTDEKFYKEKEKEPEGLMKRIINFILGKHNEDVHSLKVFNNDEFDNWLKENQQLIFKTDPQKVFDSHTDTEKKENDTNNFAKQTDQFPQNDSKIHDDEKTKKINEDNVDWTAEN